MRLCMRLQDVKVSSQAITYSLQIYQTMRRSPPKTARGLPQAAASALEVLRTCSKPMLPVFGPSRLLLTLAPDKQLR